MLLALAALLGPVFAQDDAERLRRLEEQVLRQQQEIDELKRAAAAAAEYEISFTDGFHLRTADGAYDLHVGGRFLEHYRHVFGRPDGPRTEPDSFYVREAFLQADGTIRREFGFRVVGDFTSSSSGPAASLEQAYLEWKRYPEFTLRFGQYRQPAGQEGVTETPFIDCVERSILSRFVPNLDLGLMVYGEIDRGVFAYQLSAANGRAEPSAQARSTNDNNDEKEALLRLTASPWVADPDHPLGGLRVGAYGSVTDVDDVPMASQFDVTTTELDVTILDSTAGLLNGRQWRAGVELSYSFGPLSARGEALLRREAVNDATDAVEAKMTTRAWYGQVTFVVFGAEKVVESRLTPAQPLDVSGGRWGALEAVVRAAGARVGSGAWAAVGNSLAGQSNALLAYTAGLNWYPARNVRISGDVVLEDYHARVDFGNDTRRSSLYGLLFRFQIDF